MSPISDNLNLLASLYEVVGLDDKLCSMTSPNKQESLVLHLSLASQSESPERLELLSLIFYFLVLTLIYIYIYIRYAC